MHYDFEILGKAKQAKDCDVGDVVMANYHHGEIFILMEPTDTYIKDQEAWGESFIPVFEVLNHEINGLPLDYLVVPIKLTIQSD